MAALLELDRVTVSYGGLRALSDVSMVIPEGDERHAVMF